VSGRILALVVVLASCGSPAPPPAPLRPAIDPAALARQAFGREDCAAAVSLFRTAIERDAENLELHFKLAICTSRLGLIDDTVREFQWVLAHAPAGSDEAKIAHQWLAEAGWGSSTTSATDSGAPASDTRIGDSGISGVVTWADPGVEPQPKRRMQVHLIALPGQGIAEQRFTVRTDADGQYSFRRIPAGTYKVTNAVAGAVLWRLRVKLEPGRETTLDLNSGNSVSVRDDFPGDG
jgi:Carboxypeptidase regulatory-like domain